MDTLLTMSSFDAPVSELSPYSVLSNYASASPKSTGLSDVNEALYIPTHTSEKRFRETANFLSFTSILSVEPRSQRVVYFRHRGLPKSSTLEICAVHHVPMALIMNIAFLSEQVQKISETLAILVLCTVVPSR